MFLPATILRQKALRKHLPAHQAAAAHLVATAQLADNRVLDKAARNKAVLQAQAQLEDHRVESLDREQSQAMAEQLVLLAQVQTAGLAETAVRLAGVIIVALVTIVATVNAYTSAMISTTAVNAVLFVILLSPTAITGFAGRRHATQCVLTIANVVAILAVL